MYVNGDTLQKTTSSFIEKRLSNYFLSTKRLQLFWALNDFINQEKLERLSHENLSVDSGTFIDWELYFPHNY